MTEIYAVFQQGVYRHECGGIFTTKELAIQCADGLAAADKDSYHEYEVVPFNLNEVNPAEPVIYSCRKPTPA